MKVSVASVHLTFLLNHEESKNLRETFKAKVQQLYKRKKRATLNVALQHTESWTFVLTYGGI